MYICLNGNEERRTMIYAYPLLNKLLLTIIASFLVGAHISILCIERVFPPQGLGFGFLHAPSFFSFFSGRVNYRFCHTISRVLCDSYIIK